MIYFNTGFLFIHLFYLWLCWVFVALYRLFVVVAILLLIVVCGFLSVITSLVVKHRLKALGLQ